MCAPRSNPLYRAQRDIEYFGRLFLGVTGEEPAIDNFGMPRLGLGELLERVVELGQLAGLLVLGVDIDA